MTDIMTVLPEINGQIDAPSQNVPVNTGGETSTVQTGFDALLGKILGKMKNGLVQTETDSPYNLITQLMLTMLGKATITEQAGATDDNPILPSFSSSSKDGTGGFASGKFSDIAKDSQPTALLAISNWLAQGYGDDQAALPLTSSKTPDILLGQIVSKLPELNSGNINGQTPASSTDDISGKNPELNAIEFNELMAFIKGKKSVPSPDILSGKNTVLKIGDLPAIINANGQKPVPFAENIFGRQPELKIAEGIDFSNKKGLESRADNLFKVHGVNLLSEANTAYGNYKTADNSFSEMAAKPSGFNDLLEKIVYVAKAGNRLEVSIEHGNLGKLNIDLSLEKGTLNVHINTSDKAVRELIENNIQHIVDSLAKEGVSIGGFSVSLKDQGDNTEGAFAGDAYAKEITEIPEALESRGLVSIFI